MPEYLSNCIGVSGGWIFAAWMVTTGEESAKNTGLRSLEFLLPAVISYYLSDLKFGVYNRSQDSSGGVGEVLWGEFLFNILEYTVAAGFLGGILAALKLISKINRRLPVVCTALPPAYLALQSWRAVQKYGFALSCPPSSITCENPAHRMNLCAIPVLLLVIFFVILKGSNISSDRS
ncbi:hypothetical protein [Arsenicicoccus dermatophilus]|uniref:hypothetical protein n=1 Tax=Arsenicicoccus dermatophilus TaxID=1076331 RepID=UPI001F4C79D3|nr:hypothetical protein [Arsenicicoccus dermatophilus]MCH8614393.1 hypothetical protein [Arsenicicoccus dermatophilus]